MISSRRSYSISPLYVASRVGQADFPRSNDRGCIEANRSKVMLLKPLNHHQQASQEKPVSGV